MKAYKFKRDVTGWHWSQGISEIITYIPEANIVIYKHDKTFGINTEEKFITEAKEYISDVENNRIPEKSGETDIWPNNTFIKYIPEYTTGKTTHAPVTLMNLKEVELEITQNGIEDLLNDNKIFIKEKEEFNKSEEVFNHNLKNLILEK